MISGAHRGVGDVREIGDHQEVSGCIGDWQGM